MNDVMRAAYRELTFTEKELMATVKEEGQRLHNTLDLFPQTRHTALAKTKLEECVMWAVKGITG